MLIHFSILAVILFVSLFFEKRIVNYTTGCVERGEEFKTNIFPWLVVFGYITFIVAMRTSTNDTGVYINSFNALQGTWSAFGEQIRSARFGEDWAFDAVSILFKLFISDDYHAWFALYAGIESIAFIHVLRRNAVSFLDALFFLFCSTLYYDYFSMMRQWFVVVLLFAASKRVLDGKYIRFIILGVILAQFHASAYFMLPLFFIAKGKPWARKQNLFLALFIIGMLFMNPILNALDGVANFNYDYAVDAMKSNSGSSIIRAFIAAVPPLLAYLHKDKIDKPMINLCINMSIINFMLTLLASFTSGLFVMRFSTYTGIFNVILFPYLLNAVLKGNEKRIIKFFFYTLYFTFYAYQMNYQGAFYYRSDILGVFY